MPHLELSTPQSLTFHTLQDYKSALTNAHNKKKKPPLFRLRVILSYGYKHLGSLASFPFSKTSVVGSQLRCMTSLIAGSCLGLQYQA